MAEAEPNAAKAMLTINEARPTNRLMFLRSGDKEIALEFGPSGGRPFRGRGDRGRR
jgi:hypothetical protein